MKSKWYEFKSDAIKLRKQGFSIRQIERHLGVSRSTLSGWLKYVRIAPRHSKRLLKRWKNALVKARKKAVLWHNAQKKKRLECAKFEAIKLLNSINVKDPKILEFALAMLYLGEGTRKSDETAMSNSDPTILKFFLVILRKVYNLDVGKIRCELGIRADQDPNKIRNYWARELRLPLKNFKCISVDKRTKGSKTYHYYKGVCQLRCGNIAIQRKLIYVGNLFIREIIKKNLISWTRSSVG